MSFHNHLFPRDACISCPDTTPVCNCSPDQDCILKSRTCNTCASIACVDKSGSGAGSGSSVNPGVIAGPVVAALVIASLILFFWFRRRRNRDIRQVEAIRRATLKAEQAGLHLGSAPNTAIPPLAPRSDRDVARSPSLNHRERAAAAAMAMMDDADADDGDGSSERFPREAVRGSFDALTFGSGQAGWSHLQRSPHGTLGQPGGGRHQSGPHDDAALAALGITRTYSGTSINLDPAHPSNRDRLLTATARSGGATSPSTSFRQELERDRDGLNPFSDRQSIATDALSFGSTNVIPIAFVPPMGSASASEAADDHDQQLHPNRNHDSAMALDAARRELENMRGGQVRGGPPTRPRRSPELDLRLNAAAAAAGGGGGPPTAINGRYITSSHADSLETLGGNGRTDDGRPQSSRQSFQTSRTTHSIAPSFFSSQTDLAMDVPMILTSRQVQVGKREVAEVVQLSGSNPNSSVQHVGLDTAAAAIHPRLGPNSSNSPLTRSPRSATSSASDPFDDFKSQRHGAGGGSIQHASSQHPLGRHVNGQDGLDGDLRFSMGSFALRGDRDSFSTLASQGTGRYTGRDVVVGEARKVFVGQQPSAIAGMLPPRPAFSNQAGHRESMMSGRSDADSLLGSFPIIPPSPDGQEAGVPATQLPSSMSSRSMVVPQVPSSPAPAVQTSAPPRRESVQSDMTTMTANSLLASFPQVPGPRTALAPASDPLEEEALTDDIKERAGKRTTGISVASEGLSAFDFRFGNEDDEDVPPVPALLPRPADERPGQ